MYNRHKIFIIVLSAIIFVLSYYFKIKTNQVFITNLIIFYSIMLGFYMTSMAMICGSNYAKSLSKIEDKKKTGQTLLHTLRQYFTCSFYILICSIIKILLASLLMPLNNQIFHSSILIFLSSNVFLLILWLKILNIGLIENQKSYE